MAKIPTLAAPVLPEFTQDDFKTMFDAASIHYRDRNVLLKDLNESGSLVQQYFAKDTGQYYNDLDDNRGVTMIGSAEVRNTLFPVFAKIATLRSNDVFYVQLSDLADALLEPETSNVLLDKCLYKPALFIEDFYDDSIECRYDKKELRRIESFVRDRISNNRRVYLSVSRTPQHMDWYSRGLQELLATCNRNFPV